MEDKDRQQRITSLLKKYSDKNISQEEYLELFEYIGDPKNEYIVYEAMDEEFKTLKPDAEVHDIDWDTMYKNITETKDTPTLRYKGWRYAAAAAILFLIAFGIDKYVTNLQEPETIAKTEISYDVEPAKDRAVLTLADGSTIDLGANTEGKLALQGSTKISKTDGRLVYQENNSLTNTELHTNKITTPRGGKYQVVLSDGTKVWLNAASSLKYPAQFAKEQRVVELEGEAYFEVAKDKAKPFLVKTEESTIRVLGTHFNISAYEEDRKGITTLIEGSIEYNSANFSRIIKPGEKVVSNLVTKTIKVQKADITETLAWKNGIFVFNATNLGDIMKDVSRWYDVDVVYEGEKPELTLTGVIPRSANVSAVLKTIKEAGDITYKIEGKTVFIKKKS